MTNAKQVRARLHRLVCHGQIWNEDCQRDGGRHERETWPLPMVRSLIADMSGEAMHDLVCSLELDQTRSCPVAEGHARIIYDAMTKEC